MGISKLLVLVSLINVGYSVAQTTTFDINPFYPNPINLEYQGDAHVPPGSTELRLTNPVRNSVGRVVYTAGPIEFWEPGKQADFETTIVFSISALDNSTNPADGLTFFIAPADYTFPTTNEGGNFGIFGPNGTGEGIFAVEFDVYKNDWDPEDRHIGIDIESRVSKANTTFDSLGLVTALIDYNPNTRTTKVSATINSLTTTLSYVHDLKTVLPRQVQVGLSASTGLFFAVHQVHSWYYTSTLVWDKPNQATYITL